MRTRPLSSVVATYINPIQEAPTPKVVHRILLRAQRDGEVKGIHWARIKEAARRRIQHIEKRNAEAARLARLGRMSGVRRGSLLYNVLVHGKAIAEARTKTDIWKNFETLLEQAEQRGHKCITIKPWSMKK